jgi:hypothetical protein
MNESVRKDFVRRIGDGNLAGTNGITKSSFDGRKKRSMRTLL